jgi:hypothetical protein
VQCGVGTNRLADDVSDGSSASLDHILKLLGAWLVVFVVYGIIFMEVFGLTSYGPNGTPLVNFRDFGSTLLMLIRTSTGYVVRDCNYTSP